MKLTNILGFVSDLRNSLQIALLPTLKSVLREPSLLLMPLKLRRVYMAHVWTVYGDGIDEGSRAEKEKLLRANARGVVLELGAGHGHSAKYFDKERVTAYVALEPNALMHGALRKTAREAGFVEEDGTFLLLGLPAEDIAGVRRGLDDWAAAYGEQHRARGIYLSRSSPSSASAGPSHSPAAQVDTMVSVLTLCSVPRPLRTLRALVRDVLAGGGELLFYEHVRSARADVAWWQDVVAPLWKQFFDGCVVGLDGVGIVREAGWARADLLADGEEEEEEEEGREGRVWGEEGWASMEVWEKEGEEEENLFWHQSGRCVKKAVVNGIH